MKFNIKDKIFWALYLCLIALHLLAALIIITIEFGYGMDPSDLYSSDIYYSVYVLFSLTLLYLAFYTLFKKTFFAIYKKLFLGYILFVLPVEYVAIFQDQDWLMTFILLFLTPLPILLIEKMISKKQMIKSL